LFLFVISLIFSINLFLENYLKSDPTIRPPQGIVVMTDGNQDMVFNNLQIEERNRIKQIRLNDLSQIQTTLLLSIIPLAIGSFVIGYVVSGRFLKPINDLNIELKELQFNDLGRTFPVEVNDEVGNLIHTFNNLSLRLKTASDNQEQFIQDASHELRTPLTIIHLKLDSILEDESATKLEIIEAIHNALKSVKDLQKLTEYLLELSNTNKDKFKQIDLLNIVDNQFNLLGNFATANNVVLNENIDSSIKYNCKGDEILLGRAIYNLIENGIKYCSNKDGKVEISLIKEDNILKLSIIDNGNGIDNDLKDKIFERFYRIDKSRNKSIEGFGLGLALVKKVVDLHGGKVNLDSKKGRTEFRLELKSI
jgi:signal transduction histidine kinase